LNSPANPRGLFPQSFSGFLVNPGKSEDMGVRPFCGHYGVHVRTLERMFNKYVGTTPKGFLRLNRFQTALNRLLNSGHENLTELTHDFNFYDQPHFIREFKSFTGSSPSRFVKEKQAIMQITKIV
jgi:AraC-like DNA-binding protein